MSGIPDWSELVGQTARWPFAPGEGPFHVKGGSYRGHRLFMDAQVPGGSAGIVAGLDPSLQRFYAQPFLASSWYDLAPLVAMASVCGAALGISPEEYVRRRARFQAEQDIRGVYAFFVKLVSARTIAGRLPKLITLYFDFIATETQTVDERRVVTQHHGLPAPLAPWLAAVATAYVGRVIELAKPGDHQVRTTELEAEGEAHGVPLVGFALEVTI